MELDCNHHVNSFNRAEALEDQIFKLTDSPIGIPEGDYTFHYSYPLSKPAKFKHALAADASIIDILLEGRADYRAIYAIEDASSGVNAGKIPGMLNRIHTDGSYGIWGHDISDLYFEGINIDVERREITFNIGS